MVVDVARAGLFALPEAFLAGYRSRPVPWGFGALSWVAYKRTYSRDGEGWWQTCRRVVEGTFTLQRAHCAAHGLPWDEGAAQAEAARAYERMWDFRWLPPGRGLWIMGTPFVYERGGAALNNCGFVSTADLSADYGAPFRWTMDMLLLGVGVGFDTRGRATVRIVRPARSRDVHVVEDCREAWADAAARLLRAYAGRGALPAGWDLSRLRPRGAPLRSFGGVASGPEPLRALLADLDALHASYVGRMVDAALIVDTMNLLGRCVVAGGVRRSAEIAFGDPGDATFLDLKGDAEKLAAWRWASNNSVLAELGMDYQDVARRTARNGEPGYLWLENARAYGRMGDPPDGRDEGALGSNPCAEQTLWDRELCTLVETCPARHGSLDDYLTTLRAAYLYAKTVTLVPTHDAASNAVMLRNRRVGCSMTGVVQALAALGYRRFFRWCDAAYRYLEALDAELSARFAVPRSIKRTSVKPSGTVSLLPGATPGVHWDHAPYYLRRVRLAADDALVAACREAGYPVEPDRWATGAVVVSFPVHVPGLGRRKAEVSLREKLDLAAQMQRYWADNQVSCTADFDPEREGGELPALLEAYEDRLKGVAFLPTRAHGYAQPPYEEITREAYEALVARTRPLRGAIEHEHAYDGMFCEGGACAWPPF